MSAAAAELPGSAAATGIRPEKGWYKTMEKTYTLDDFRMNTYAYKPIEAEGLRSIYGDVFEINDSSILTELIHEAGRYCERFASDLFFDWGNVQDAVGAGANTTFLFGFRQDGVDHNSFIFSRYASSGDLARYNYRSLWRLDIKTKGDRITETLGRVF